MTQTQTIIPCLWFDSNAEEAANFYVSLLPNSQIGRILRHGEVRYDEEGQEVTGEQPGSVWTVDFQFAGYRFTGLNGGPHFTINPSISFFVNCATESEIDALWTKLVDGGMALMDLAKYPWSEKYGWVQDRFGISWQLMMGKMGDGQQTIVPCLMYVGAQNNKAEEAINLYVSTFKESEIHFIDRYQAGEGNTEGAVKHAQFSLNGERFVAMDGGEGHAFNFNEALSLQILCETQSEIDHYWTGLIADGGEEGPCGWLKDRFGMSWQVTPTVLYEMLHDTDMVKSQRAIKDMFQMSKFDIATLEKAFGG